MVFSNPLVSIIMPAYNSAHTIKVAIESVLEQTFTKWELIIVNDCSTDRTASVVELFTKQDERIKLYSTDKPSGSPTLPRNIGLEKSVGRYIAFLDSDDVWLPNKLEEQLPLFEDPNVTVVFSYYQKMDCQGKLSSKIIKSPDQVNYEQLLRGNVIGNLTAMYDSLMVGKVLFRHVGHEDYAFWLSILRRGGIAKNTAKVHGYYRITANSLSSNKFKAMLWNWNIFRNVEHLNLLKASYCFVCYSIKGFKKALC